MVEQLYHNFLMVLQPMEASHQIFDVISRWIFDLKTAEEAEKCPDSDIDDASFAKIKSYLHTEIETWDLLAKLYYHRLNPPDEQDMDSDQLLESNDMYHINETEAMMMTVGRNQILQEMNIIIQWLEANYPSRRDPPDLIEKFINWEQTFECLKKEKMLRTASKGVMVQHIDPDALTRESKQLHPLDEADAAKSSLGSFYYLRVGDFNTAFSFLHESGNTAAGAALFGTQYTAKAEKTDAAPSIMHHIPEINRRSTHQKPGFNIIGNTRRDMWKSIAFLVCDKNQQSKYERAALGAVCGHREALLQAATSWEDQLWSYLKTSYDVGVEQAIRSLGTSVAGREYIPMPQKYWEQNSSVEECIQIVDGNFQPFKPFFTPEFVFRNVQRTVMMDTPSEFLHPYSAELSNFVGAAEENPEVLSHTIRFVVHLLIVYKLFGKDLNQDVIDFFTILYADILVKNGHLVYLPFYVQKVNVEGQIPLIAHHICAITTETSRVSKSDIELFLKTSQLNGIDPLEIGVAVVSKLREREEGFAPENLDWISLSYNYVSDTKQVMLALLRTVLLISRSHFRHGEVDKVRRVIREIRKKCLEEVSMLSEVFRRTYIKEFECYKMYLEAETDYFRWLNVLQQEPKLEDKLPESSTLADRAVYDRRVREHQIKKKRWENNFTKLTEAVFDKFKSVLSYPQGFLLNCTAEENGQLDVYEVNLARRYLIGNMVRFLMKLVGSQKNFPLLREFTKLLSSKYIHVYQVLSTEEISNTYVWIETYVRTHSKSFAQIPV